MRRVLLLPIVLSSGMLVWCARDKTPLGPVAAPRGPVQLEIPWPSLAKSPWPMFRHDPQLSGRSPYVGPRKGRIKWAFKPGGTVYSAIVIGEDGAIFFPFCNGGPGNRSGLYALTPTGEVKWKLLLDLDNEVQPLVTADGTIVLVGHAGPPDRRVLLTVGQDGSLEGQFDLPCELSTLLNIGVDGTLYCAMGGDLSAFTKTGQLLWKVSPNEPGGYFAFQPVAIAPNGGTLYVFEKRAGGSSVALRAVGVDGTDKWSYRLPGTQRSDFCAVDCSGQVSFATHPLSAAGTSGLYCLTPTSELRWHYPEYLSDLFLIDWSGFYYLSSGLGGSSVLSVDSEGALRWKKPFEADLSGFVCDCEGVIYSCSAAGVNAFNSAGELLWHVPYGIEARSTTRVSCPAIGADGTLYVGTYSNYPYSESVVLAIE